MSFRGLEVCNMVTATIEVTGYFLIEFITCRTSHSIVICLTAQMLGHPPEEWDTPNNIPGLFSGGPVIDSQSGAEVGYS
jgi:hypothetical protein